MKDRKDYYSEHKQWFLLLKFEHVSYSLSFSIILRFEFSTDMTHLFFQLEEPLIENQEVKEDVVVEVDEEVGEVEVEGVEVEKEEKLHLLR